MIELNLKLESPWPQKNMAKKIIKMVEPELNFNGFHIKDGKKVVDQDGSEIAVLKSNLTAFEDNEIWIFFENSPVVQRFYRPSSNSNSILITERCDQLCIMCSQPPKNKDYLYFEEYFEALSLINSNALIGITGGEPSLYKDELLKFLIKILEKNTNLTFQVLTNAQNFEFNDIEKLKQLGNRVEWAIPVYSSVASKHDEIVGKQGAFDRLLEVLPIFALSSSRVEIRTVLMQQNQFDLPELARFIAGNLPWVSHWALMQLERFGYARLQWENKFVDTSADFSITGNAISICESFGMPIKLFNFPYCSVPKSFQNITHKSISDWKQKYLEFCKDCNKKNDCCGVFEWYHSDIGFTQLDPILS